ncbi:uncharacterized protein LOC111271486 isoform X3 [Varroa jacobsoni]|uniref:uncharacterized protein LOC111271486 isoform X3 n=1 Tax=Varroa jacobsoni TaxID=62625 RepID=UPI000BF368BA|nr:uncharacterized protein LOC111271486 isoform X3 [Varroa jacobsoni]
MRMANVLDRELFLDDVTYRVFANGKSGLGSGSQVSDFSVRLPRSFLFLLVRLLAYPFSSKLRTIKPKNPEWRCFFFFKQRRSRSYTRFWRNCDPVSLLAIGTFASFHDIVRRTMLHVAWKAGTGQIPSSFECSIRFDSYLF